MYNKRTLEKALFLLSEKLKFKGKHSYILFVCGGLSLLFQNIIARPTKDVDIIALGESIDNNIKLKSAKPFPQELEKLSREVADDLQLEINWLNPGPTDLLKFGLPENFINRCIKKKYNEKLTVFFTERYDQIHFKLFAAVDQGPGKHLQDLMQLNPNQDEIFAASKWALTQDCSFGFKKILIEMLNEIGFKDVAERI